MGYVAIRGGEKAITEAAGLLDFLRARGAKADEQPLDLAQIEHQLHFLHGAVLSEGGLYDRELASLAIKQSLGDPVEAAFYVRAYCCTRSRIAETRPLDTSRMRLIRRVSAAFKDVPGSQMLGPTPDFSQRLFNLELIDESPQAFRGICERWMQGLDGADVPDSVPKVLDYLHANGLLDQRAPCGQPPMDITRQPIIFPLPRSAALSIMARAQQGSLLAMAYSNMRGYGDDHPVVAELRVGYLPVELPHLVTGEPIEVGEVLITECEIVCEQYQGGEGHSPTFGLGYGACFGHNELKAISMAILDRALQFGRDHGARQPSEDAEFVLMNIDGCESMGYCQHWKMPHYVTFQSALDRLRNAQRKHATKEEQP
jgi:alpha-D-ribose 1-methylphosphonate 5-triphosphate synthase subunit PhnI